MRDWVYRAAGVPLLLLTLTPIHRVLRQPGTGRFGESAVMRSASNLEMAWWGILVAVGVGGVLFLLLPTSPLRRTLAQVDASLSRIPVPRLAAGLGLLAAGMSLVSGLELFHGLPTLVDGMVARLQGRSVAHGLLAIQLPEPREAWVIPNTVLTPRGWVSQYPPFPSLLLGLGELVGMPWLIFPLLVGGTVTLTTLLAARLLPESGTEARLGALLLAISPFLILLGGGYLSHVPALAFTALALYAAARALDGGAGWALLVGLGSGAAVASRPLHGLILTVLLPGAWWAVDALRTGRTNPLLRRLVLAFAGGFPLALGLGLYNRYFFGSASRLGYTAAYGPAHDLGFHVDPWGNLYTPLEALGFTAVDLTGMGTYLLETPIPATVLVGLLFLLRPRNLVGKGILLAWAFLPVAANFFYWHHGFHLGPRMLYESAPAWALLAAAGALALAREPRRGQPGPDGPDQGRASVGSGGPRRWVRLPDLVLWTLSFSFLGGGVLAVNRALSYRWSTDTLARITVPPIPSGDPALVFVHGSWSERISARLQASGMRLDSIETALRRNDICALHAYAAHRVGRGGAGESIPGSSGLDFSLLAETPPALEPFTLTEGNRILVDPDRPVTAECRREARADARGIVSLAPLLWQGDLPGMEDGRAMFVRDLGPEGNEGVRGAFPNRRPYLLMTPEPGARPELVDYWEGMAIIWGEEEP